MTNVFLLTGRPGIGKTTALARIIEILRRSGLTVGGLMSREKRVGGIRQGFELLDILSGVVGTLADMNCDGPRLGKYRVNLPDLRTIGVRALENSLRSADIIVIDEIGPMELFSEEFVSTIRKVLGSGKPVIGTIHYNLRHPIVKEIRLRQDAKILEVTYDNRDEIPEIVAKRILSLLGR